MAKAETVLAAIQMKKLNSPGDFRKPQAGKWRIKLQPIVSIMFYL